MKIRIDERRHEVFVGDKRVHIPTKEYLLLSALMSDDKMWSRDELLEKVWGHKVKVTTRTVDQHCARLRRKIPKGVIETVHGFGYRLSQVS